MCRDESRRLLAVSLLVCCAAACVWAAECEPVTMECPKGGACARQGEDGWIVLFDGSSMDCWQNARKPDAKNQWFIEDGLLTNEHHANNIGTKCVLKDFELHLEYKIVKDGNSGVYLRGRVEVQILDSYGREQVVHADNGGIYGQFPPLVNASKPAGEWNTLEARYVGDVLTVTLNDRVVQNEQRITSVTGGALPGDVNEAGPLMLQGDHGKIWFRNIRVRPLEAK